MCEEDTTRAKEGIGVFIAGLFEEFSVIGEGLVEHSLLFEGLCDAVEGGFVFGEDFEGLLEVVLCFGGVAQGEGDLSGLFV